MSIKSYPDRTLRSFDSTYEGLKRTAQLQLMVADACFDSTYEGLKRGWSLQCHPKSICFDSTYEGLKRT